MPAMDVLKCQRVSKSSVILLQRLMQLAQNLPICVATRRRRRGVGTIDVAGHEAEHAAQESIAAFGACIGPVQVAFGRRGKQFEHAARVGAEAARSCHRR